MKTQFIDLELLCWPDGITPQGQTNHIIQIGIVEVETENLKISRTKNYYVRPQDRNFEVSDYCTQLTGITRSKIIDEGRYFPEVMRTIKKEFAPQTKLTYAWGSDYEPIAKHCSDYYESDVSNPWAANGIWDFGLIFRIAFGHTKKMPLIDALESLGLTFEGRQHDAENDARALAHLHNEMMKRLRTSMKG
jgi:inhibitor of KinA sporulation pathway (predicted exonuclease)